MTFSIHYTRQTREDRGTLEGHTVFCGWEGVQQQNVLGSKSIN